MPKLFNLVARKCSNLHCHESISAFRVSGPLALQKTTGRIKVKSDYTVNTIA